MHFVSSFSRRKSIARLAQDAFQNVELNITHCNGESSGVLDVLNGAKRWTLLKKEWDSI